MTNCPLIGTAAEAATLRAALEAAGYRLTEVAAALQLEDDTEAIRSYPLLPTEPGTDPRLATLIDLFLSGAPRPAADVESALGLPAGRLTELGLVTPEAGEAGGPDEVRATVRLQPWSAPGGRDIWLITDQPAFSHDLADDYVLNISQSALLLERFTVRRHFERVLDMGAGSGLHALLAARDAGRVVATDVIGRALEMCRWNAWLNELPNVETREGSLYEPVAGEQFDLVLSNPPFVVSPGKQWAYRDGGLSGDGFSREAVRGAAGHLVEGGMALVEVNWIVTDMANTEARLGEWCDGLDCDVLVFRRHITAPRQYAVVWSAPNRGEDVDAYRAELARWADTFRHRGAVGIGGGVIVLRRRTATAATGDNWMVTLDSPSPGVGSGEVVAQLLAAHSLLQQGWPRWDLRLTATDHSVEETLLPDRTQPRYGTASATLRRHPPMRFSLDADRLDLEIMTRARAEITLGELASAVGSALGVDDANGADFAGVVANRVRVLVGLGFLQPR